MRKQKSRQLGLTTEEWIQITGDDPEFWDIVKRDSDVMLHVGRLSQSFLETARQVLKDAGLPSELPEVLRLSQTKLSANAELARRILSNVNENPLFVQNKACARAFVAGYELALWTRQLLTNLAYERQIQGAVRTSEGGRAGAQRRHVKEQAAVASRWQQMEIRAKKLKAAGWTREEILEDLTAKFPVKRSTILHKPAIRAHLPAVRRNSSR